MLGLQYQLDPEGMILIVPTGTEGAYLTLEISPQILDKMTEQWYAIAKNEIVTIPRRKSRNRRFTGTIQRS